MRNWCIVISTLQSQNPAAAQQTPAAMLTPSDARLKMAAQSKLGRRIAPADPALVRQTASQLVSQLFFQPMLAEMRKLPFGGEIGKGGRGEEVFGEQLDQRVADAVADTTAGALKATIARALSRSGDAAPAVSTPAGPIAAQTTWPTLESLRRDLRQQAVSALAALTEPFGASAAGALTPASSTPAAGEGVSR